MIYYSSYILPDALATLLSFGSLLLLLLDQKPGKSQGWTWGASGVLAGLSVATAIRYLPLATIVLVVVPILSEERRRIRNTSWAVIGFVIGSLAGSPGFLLDLDGQLLRISSLTWGHDGSWPHRLESLVYYIRGMFAPGFASGYVDSTTGSVGFGPVVGFLVAIGMGRLASARGRIAIALLALVTFHLWSITPVVQRYTRHALPLYPVACLLAGVGLQAVADGLRKGLQRLGRTSSRWGANGAADRRGWLGQVVLLLFLVMTGRQAWLSAQYVRRVSDFDPSQSRMADFMSEHVASDLRVGILDALPWDEYELWEKGIEFVRVGRDVTLEELRELEVDYLVGTDRIGGDFRSQEVTAWESELIGTAPRLAEFGSEPLGYPTYPQAEIYLFLVEVPRDGSS